MNTIKYLSLPRYYKQAFLASISMGASLASWTFRHPIVHHPSNSKHYCIIEDELLLSPIKRTDGQTDGRTDIRQSVEWHWFQEAARRDFKYIYCTFILLHLRLNWFIIIHAVVGRIWYREDKRQASRRRLFIQELSRYTRRILMRNASAYVNEMIYFIYNINYKLIMYEQININIYTVIYN